MKTLISIIVILFAVGCGPLLLVSEDEYKNLKHDNEALTAEIKNLTDANTKLQTEIKQLEENK